jgi:hypothetical protein
VSKGCRRKKAHISELDLDGGLGQNRTADTRIFNFKNHHFIIILGPPSLAKTCQNVTKLSRQYQPDVLKIYKPRNLY